MSSSLAGVRGWYAGLLTPTERDPLAVAEPGEGRRLRTETILVLGVSLGSSAVYAVLSINE